MKRLLFLLALSCPAWAVINPNVHSAAGSATSSTTVAITTTSTTGGNDLWVGCVTNVSGFSHVTGISVTGGAATFTLQGSRQTFGASWTVEEWEAHGITGGTTALTVTLSATTGEAKCIYAEMSGVAAVGSAATPTTGTSAAPSISATTPDANDYVIAFAGSGQVANPNGVTTGTLIVQSSGSTLGALAGYNTAAGAGTVTVTSALTGSDSWGMVALVLRSTSGGGAASPNGQALNF